MNRQKTLSIIGVAMVAIAILGAGLVAIAGPSAATEVPIQGIKVDGNQLVDSTTGQIVQLHGVNRNSTEYACAFGYAIANADTTEPVQTMIDELDTMVEDWNINTVRVPINQDCWLGVAKNDPDRPYGLADREPYLVAQWTGANYRNAIAAYVDEITSRGMVAIVDLHWTGPDDRYAFGQQAMADENSLDAWTSMANTFEDDPNVIFDLFNEPFIGRDGDINVDASWDCWLDGCVVPLHGSGVYAGNQSPNDQLAQVGRTFQAVGMQDLLDAVRGAGATNPVMLGGLNYAQHFHQFLEHLPNDSVVEETQLIASWHAYPGNTCGLTNRTGCAVQLAAIRQVMPIVAGEFGSAVQCAGNPPAPTNTAQARADIEAFLDTMDAAPGGPISYVAWNWLVTGAECPSDNHYDVIADYDGTASPIGSAVRAHYLTRLSPDLPDLAITKTHQGNFTVGQPGTFTLTVTNVGDAALPADSQTIVREFVGPGLTITAISGNGWDCQVDVAYPQCVRTGALAVDASFSSITVTVSVAEAARPTTTNNVVLVNLADGDRSNNSVTDRIMVNAAGSTTSSTSSTSSSSSTSSTSSTTSTTVTSSTASTVPATTIKPTATTVAGTNRTLAVTGDDTKVMALAALALLGVGFLVAGQSMQVAPATTGRRRRR